MTYMCKVTLLLADVFKNFRDMCIREYKLDPAHFLSLPGLAFQACLKYRIRTIDRLRYATNGGRRNKRWNMPLNTPIC